jgi:hypothetical protein
MDKILNMFALFTEKAYEGIFLESQLPWIFLHNTWPIQLKTENVK